MSAILDRNLEIIDNALQTAQEAVSNAEDAANDAIRQASASNTFSQPYPGWAPTADEPSVYIPTTIAETDPYIRYQIEKQNLTDWLAGLFTNFFNTYYPLTSDAFDEAMAWLVNTITNGGTGIPAAIENQIWQRYRDGIQKSSTQAENAAYADFASRGFSLPSGVLTARLDTVRTEGILKMSEAARDVAIKQIEIEIDNIKFAVKEAIDARMKALAAAIDYIKAMALAPEISAKVSDQNTGTQARLIAATADFYRARLSRDELSYKAWATLMDQKSKDGGINVDAWGKGINARVQASLGAADTYAKTASSALSSLSSVVSVSTQAFEEGE